MKRNTGIAPEGRAVWRDALEENLRQSSTKFFFLEPMVIIIFGVGERYLSTTGGRRLFAEGAQRSSGAAEYSPRFEFYFDFDFIETNNRQLISA